MNRAVASSVLQLVALVVGLALVVWGVALFSTAAALIVAGVFVVVLTFAWLLGGRA